MTRNPRHAKDQDKCDDGCNHDPPSGVGTHLPALTIDYDLMASCLEGCDASEDEVKELVEAVCRIMITFVDLGFGIEPSQQALLAGQTERAPTTLPFMDMIVNSELAARFNSTTETDNKEKTFEGSKDEV